MTTIVGFLSGGFPGDGFQLLIQEPSDMPSDALPRSMLITVCVLGPHAASGRVSRLLSGEL